MEIVLHDVCEQIRLRKIHKATVRSISVDIDFPKSITEKEIIAFQKNIGSMIQFSNELNIGPNIPMFDE
jgi:hypothetical protein